MNTTDFLRLLRSAWLPAFALSLLCTPAAAHEVHDSHEPIPEPTAADIHYHESGEDRQIKAYIRAFRITGDDDHLDRAWQLLEPMLDDHHAGAAVLVDAATVAQARHEFGTAMNLLERALATGRDRDRALLLKASIHLVRGEATAATRACVKLRNVTALIAITCRARAAIAAGHSAKVLPKLSAIIDKAIETDPQTLAWALSVAGDAAAEVDLPRSVDFYRRALTLSESAQVRSALVDVLLRLGRLDEAQAALDQGSHALPLELRRWIVASRSGNRNSLAHEIEDADHTFQHWMAEGDWLHAREMARFYLDVIERPELASRIARVNLSIQREPEDLRLACRVSLESACTH